MTITLQSTPDLWDIATAHLRGAPERLMFFTGSGDNAIVIADYLIVPDNDLDTVSWHAQLTEDAQQGILQWAAARAGWLIELHSHLGAFGDPAQLSSIDVAGLHDWVPHVRWRLHQRPYAALVLGPRTIDGIAWTGSKTTPPVAIHSWDVDGVNNATTGLSLASFTRSA